MVSNLKRENGNTKCLKTLYSHTGTVVSLLKPINDSDLLLSLSIDKSVRLWSTSIGKIKKILFRDAAPTKMILFIKANKILFPQWNNTLCLIDVPNLLNDDVNSFEYKGHTSWVLDAIELLNSKQFATCSRDKTIKIWEYGNDNCVMTLKGHNGNVNSLLEVKQNTILSSSSDFYIKVWNLDLEGECVFSIKDGELPVFQIEIVGENQIITRSESNYMNVWNFQLGNLIRTFKSHKTNVICMKVLKDGRIASGSYDHSVKIWNVNEDFEQATLLGHTFTVYCIEQMENGNILSGSGDTTIKVWDCKTYQCLATIEGHRKYVVSLLDLGNKIFASGGYDNIVNVWKIESG